jgi:hypothetical protein
MPVFLVWFSQHNYYYNLRFHELESLAEMNGVSKEDLYRGCYTPREEAGIPSGTGSSSHTVRSRSRSRSPRSRSPRNSNPRTTSPSKLPLPPTAKISRTLLTPKYPPSQQERAERKAGRPRAGSRAGSAGSEGRSERDALANEDNRAAKKARMESPRETSPNQRTRSTSSSQRNGSEGGPVSSAVPMDVSTPVRNANDATANSGTGNPNADSIAENSSDPNTAILKPGTVLPNAKLSVPATHPTSLNEESYVYVNLPNQDVVDSIMERAVLIKYIVEVWADAPSHEDIPRSLAERCADCEENFAENFAENHNGLSKGSPGSSPVSSPVFPNSRVDSNNFQKIQRQLHFTKDKSLCIKALGYGSSLTQAQKDAKIARYADILSRRVLPTSEDEVKAGLEKFEAEKRRIEETQMHVESDDVKTTSDDVKAASLKAGTLKTDLTAAKVGQVRDRFHLPIRKIDIRNPDTALLILEDYGSEETHQTQRKLKRVFIGLQRGPNPAKVPKDSAKVVSGKDKDNTQANNPGLVKKSNPKQSNQTSPYWEKYGLAKRGVLGPTTMENELAFLMANQAQAGKDKLVMDPFCGTGGILVGMSHFSPLAFGNDIDARVLRGWRIAYVKNQKAVQEVNRVKKRSAKDKDIFTNFYQYGLKKPEILVLDNAHPPWRKVGMKYGGMTSNAMEEEGQLNAEAVVETKPWIDGEEKSPYHGSQHPFIYSSVTNIVSCSI